MFLIKQCTYNFVFNQFEKKQKSKLFYFLLCAVVKGTAFNLHDDNNCQVQAREKNKQWHSYGTTVVVTSSRKPIPSNSLDVEILSALVTLGILGCAQQCRQREFDYSNGSFCLFRRTNSNKKKIQIVQLSGKVFEYDETLHESNVFVGETTAILKSFIYSA